MWKRIHSIFLSLFIAYPVVHVRPIHAQTTGIVRGAVTLAASGNPLHHASVSLNPGRRRTDTKDDGSYELQNVPPGKYTLTAHMHALTDERKTIEVMPGAEVVVDFALRLAAVKEEVTVTASGTEQSTFEAFQTVASLDTLDLAAKAETSLGEVLNNQPGVAKRSFGPGSSRPVIRGFDGDRVLVMQDGVSTGTLSSQSGDHGESIDVATLERLEVIKGPATLLYGSNALGGVVNAITGHHQLDEHPHSGMRGYVTGVGGTANGHSGGSAGFEYGLRNWLLWGSGGGQRAGDYSTPAGKILNSESRIANGSGGLGYYTDKRFIDAGHTYERGRYGVPFAGQFESGPGQDPASIDLTFRRQNTRFNTGFRNSGSAIDGSRFSLNYSDWQHRELEDEITGAIFRNKQLTYRGVFSQRKTGPLTGSFGVSGLHRDYKATGAETLAPPVTQNGLAGFVLEELAFERFRLQFGGRVENNRYDPAGLRSRSFTGLSGAAGIHVPLWKGGAFVANFASSYRAPALEELYNNGPHIGNLTFEAGNADLERERSHGTELSLRHQSKKLHAEINLFRYNISDFVFLAPTGEIEDGLRVAEYEQASSRYMGAETELDIGLHPAVWLNLGMDFVDAQIRESHMPLPRIPPLRGRVGIDLRRGGLSLKPQLLLSGAQHQIFSTETRTAGFATFNLGASYTLAQQHFVHVWSLNLFNATGRLYRNHLSLIKDLAPEIGRGVKFTYTVRFF
ncbi:MAG: TonB-dependent receptor [Bryobacteraceae bacterium]